MGNRAPGNTNTGGGVKGKKVRTTSDDADAVVSKKSKSTGGKCASRSNKPQYFVHVMKD